MKLYSFSGSCALATNIVLAWIDQPYEVQLIEKDDLAKPEMRRLNPLGKVPILEDEGRVLYENASVLHYLAEKFPAAKLNGDGSLWSHAEVNRWLAIINADVHPAYKPLFGATAYLDDEAAVQKTRDHARAELRQYFEFFDTHLGQQDWLAGMRSIADPYLFVTVNWTHFVHVDISGLDHLKGFEQRMRADAGVQRALKEQKLAAA